MSAPQVLAQLTLAEKMIARADADKLPAGHDLRIKAAELQTVTHDSTPKQIVGRWARAETAWSQYTGEKSFAEKLAEDVSKFAAGLLKLRGMK